MIPTYYEPDDTYAEDNREHRILLELGEILIVFPYYGVAAGRAFGRTPTIFIHDNVRETDSIAHLRQKQRVVKGKF